MQIYFVFAKFNHRSNQLERLDTGDYTSEEYESFLIEISRVNRFLGDISALKKSLFQEVKSQNLSVFSALDVGAGSGEMLSAIGKSFPQARLFGLEINKRATQAMRGKSVGIKAISGDAFSLPFGDNSFDYVICSLFTHHFKNDDVIKILHEMKRVARRKIFVIDLHRHPIAYYTYHSIGKLFLSNFVWEDGSLSILRSFKPQELKALAEQVPFKEFSVKRCFPYRVVLEAKV